MDKKNTISIVLLSLAAVALIALGAIFGTRKIKGNAEAEKAALDSLVSDVALQAADLSGIDLEGTYDFKLESDTLSTQYTATVKRTLEDDTYTITVLSDYNPEMHPFKVDGGALTSEQLGSGTATLQELTGKLTLEFHKDNTQCTLVKYLK